MLESPVFTGDFLVLAGMMEVSSKPKQIKQMLLLLGRCKQIKLYLYLFLFLSLFLYLSMGSSCCLIIPPDGGPLLPPANG